MVEEIFCWWKKNLRGVEGEKMLGVAGEGAREQGGQGGQGEQGGKGGKGGKSLRELRGKRWKKKKISP